MLLCLAALSVAGVYAASGDDFYERLYARGMAQFGEGNSAAAYASLRLAAFGMVDDIARFETAEIYMAVAAIRLKRESDALAAAQRIVAAERVQKRYASLQLPEAIRKEFEDAARKLLPAGQMAFLRTATTEVTVPAPIIVAAPPPSFSDAERALNRGQLAVAASIYRAIADAPQLTHGASLRAAEGLYRARDFAGALRAFERAGPIGAGEEHYRYYLAVALYESGRFAAAKQELRAALPFIELTPDVDRYRALIEQAPSE